MRGVYRADWDGLYLRVREGDSEALVTLRNQAVRWWRVARYSSVRLGCWSQEQSSISKGLRILNSWKRPLGALNLIAVLIDGIEFKEALLVAVLA